MRAAIRDDAATQRLVEALRKALRPRRGLSLSLPDCRSNAPVVCSRIRRQAAVFSRSRANFFTTLRTRVAEISIPCFAHTDFSES